MYTFDTTYTNLSASFYQFVDKPKVKVSRIFLLNQEFIKKLGIAFAKDPQELLGPAQEKAFAQAYAGHQFGHFTMLGDGRAMILGEQITPSKERFDVQLIGSGRTAFSRGGDGARRYYVDKLVASLPKERE